MRDNPAGFLNRHSLPSWHVAQLIRLPAGPPDLDGICLAMLAQTERQYQFALR